MNIYREGPQSTSAVVYESSTFVEQSSFQWQRKVVKCSAEELVSFFCVSPSVDVGTLSCSLFLLGCDTNLLCGSTRSRSTLRDQA